MKMTACIPLLVLSASLTVAQIPNFDYPCFVTNDAGYILENNQYLSPEFGDWDADGDLDMMLGVYYDGSIYYFENIAIGDEPNFAPYTVVEADGNPIQVSYG